MLKFSKANAKTKGLTEVSAIAKFLQGKRKVYSLDLLSGFSCPFAYRCLSKAITLQNGRRKIQDGPHTQFRCFSASQEVQYPNTYLSREHNLNMIRKQKTAPKMARLISDSMPKNLGVCRIHVAGDFFNQTYFDAWTRVARENPDKLFYAYTKSLPYWIRRRETVDSLENFVLSASYGGRKDSLIESENLRYSVVIFSENEAIARGLEIDHDDSHAADPSKKNNSFALLLHGTQPKGSYAATALKKLKGKGSYSRKKGGSK